MKKLLLFIVFVLMIASCKHEIITKVVVQGLFKRSVGLDSAYLESNNELIKIKLSSKLDIGGNFKFVLDLKKPSFFYLDCGNSYFEVFLSPGDSINIVADISNLDSTLTFSGVGASNNILLKDLKKTKTEMDRKTMYSLDEMDFTKCNDSILEVKDKLLNETGTANNGVTKEFIKVQKNENLYSWAYNNLLYKSYHQHFAKISNYEPSDKFNDYLKKLNLNDTSLLYSSKYIDFLSTYYDNKANDEAQKDTAKYGDVESFYKLKLEMLLKEIKVPKILEVLTYNTLYELVRYSGTKYLKERIMKFASETKNPEYSTNIKNELKKWQKCAPGIALQDYNYKGINGEGIAFGSFKGKLIYIDVWATWCGPCKGEIPSLKKLEEKYRKNKIVFVSDSIDNDKEAWENIVKNDKLQGVQLWAGGPKNQLCDDFNINGIPRFILIGADGLIIDPDAERPSGKIGEKLDELLKTLK